MIRLEDLEVNSTYHMFVVAENEHGTSLPSSMLLVNITGDGESMVIFIKFRVTILLYYVL